VPPKSIFDADFKNVIFFVAHLVFEISICFGFQLAYHRPINHRR